MIYALSALHALALVSYLKGCKGTGAACLITFGLLLGYAAYAARASP